MKLDHSATSEILKQWFPSRYPGGYLLQNNSGYASNEHVHYGMPNTGGGADFFVFGKGAVVEFIEVKTDGYPTISAKQKRFIKNMSSLGFKCWVFRSHVDDCYLIPAGEYRPSRLQEHICLRI